MELGDTHHTPMATCLACGVLLAASSSVDSNTAPHPGAITVCLECGHIMAFADDMTLRELTDKEAHRIAGDPILKAIMWVRGRIMKEEH